MSTQVTPVSTAGLDLSAQPESQNPPSTAQAPAIGAAAEPADYRLIIEKVPESNRYVYLTVDRKTGEVVQQFPIEQILQMPNSDDYKVGAVITARA